MIRDSVLYVSMMFLLAIVLLVAYVAFDSLDDAFKADPNINGTLASNDFSEQAQAFPKYMDFTFLTVFVAIVIGVMILGWVVASNPALFFVYVVLISILGGYAGYLSNAFADTLESGILSASAANFPIMSFIMNNYMVFVIVMVFLMLIVFFAKPNGGGGY